MAEEYDDGQQQMEEDGEGQVEEEEEEEDMLNMEDEDDGPKQDGLLMRFCPNDSSMLYPKEDKREKRLLYGCRLCRYVEDASNQPMVYRYHFKKEAGNVLHTVPSAVADDPTLARSQQENCQNCGHNEAVFFQSDIAQADSLALVFVCCNCGHKWVE